jgi:hypothetical protein
MGMRARQTAPCQWLIIHGSDDREGLSAARNLSSDTGVLLLQPLSTPQMRKLRQRGLAVVDEQRRTAARVHNIRELRRACLARTPLILMSPIYRTTSHPEWKPIPRMRAAALARLGGRKLIALGGMDARRFERIRRLGFQGWAGISAFRI